MNNSWCESCARKNVCYSPDIRPKCYLPTTNTGIICPRCGSSDYVKSFVKDWGITNSEFEYKCINCNTYFGRRSLNEQQ